MYSKYERRTDTRTYDDRRKLYEGGWDVLYAELLEKSWKEKMDEWTGRAKCKLLSGFFFPVLTLCLSIQPSCLSGSESGLARSLGSLSLLMMMTRVREMLLLELLMKRRRRRKRRKKMNKLNLIIENYKEINPLNQLTSTIQLIFSILLFFLPPSHSLSPCVLAKIRKAQKS